MTHLSSFYQTPLLGCPRGSLNSACPKLPSYFCPSNAHGNCLVTLDTLNSALHIRPGASWWASAAFLTVLPPGCPFVSVLVQALVQIHSLQLTCPHPWRQLPLLLAIGQSVLVSHSPLGLLERGLGRLACHWRQHSLTQVAPRMCILGGNQHHAHGGPWS